MNKTAILSVLLILLAQSAFASIAVLPSFEEATLSRNDSIGIQFRVKNTGYEEECISLDTEEDHYLDVDIAHAGMDQRKIHMLVREIFPKKKWKVPVAVHHKLLPGLSKPADKLQISDQK